MEAGAVPVSSQIGELSQRRALHHRAQHLHARKPDMLALPDHVPALDAEQRRDGAVRADPIVRSLVWRGERRLPRVTHTMGETGRSALRQGTAFPFRPWRPQAEVGDGHVDEPLVLPRGGLRVHPLPLQQRHRVIRDKDIRPAEQRREVRLAGPGRCVERHAPLVGVEEEEDAALLRVGDVRGEWPATAAGVPARRLDLDHVGPEIPKKLRGVGGRDEVAVLDYAQAGQSPGRRLVTG